MYIGHMEFWIFYERRYKNYVYFGEYLKNCCSDQFYFCCLFPLQNRENFTVPDWSSDSSDFENVSVILYLEPAFSIGLAMSKHQELHPFSH